MGENSSVAGYPPVSIIITSFNHGHLIGKAIESALAQDYPNLEIIISDNHSTDNSDEIIRRYLDDKRIRYSRNDINIGMLPNFKKATYELAKGDYITYVSSDDYLMDNSFISESIRLINKYDNVRLVFGRIRLIDSATGGLRDSPETPFFVKENWLGKEVFFRSPEYGFLSWGACLMQRKALYNIKGLQSGYITGDIECNYKIMTDGNVCFINKICYGALSHPQSATATVRADDKILILKCFEDISNYAVSRLPGESIRINAWRQYHLFWTGYNELKFLKTNNEVQYRVFKKYIFKNYPSHFAKIQGRLKFRLFILIWSVRNAFRKTAA